MRCKIKAATGLVDHRSVGLPPIWITDDLLESTFQRYLRSHHSTERRHFSHVPGPLEFRRRQAKRRMASATFYEAPTPPPTSWASTFNISSIIRSLRSPESQWTWQAPTAAQWHQAGSKELADGGIDASSHSDLAVQLSNISDVSGLSALQWERCPIGHDAITFSQASLQHILQLAQDMRTHDALSVIVRFLESDVNDPAAANVPVCFAWLMNNIPAHHVLGHSHFVKYMSGHVQQHDTPSTDIGALLEYCQTALQAMSRPETRKIMHSFNSIRKAVATRLNKRSETMAGDDVAAVTAGLVNMLSLLPASSRSSATLITNIAKLPPQYRDRYSGLVQNHLTDWCQYDLESSGSSKLSPLLQSVHSACSASSESTRWWQDIMLNITQTLIVHTHKMAEGHKTLQHWLKPLGKPDLFPSSAFYQDLWSQLSSILASSEGREAVMTYVSRPIPELCNGQIKVVHDHPQTHGQSHAPKVAAALIHEYLDKGQLNRALRLFHNSPDLTVDSCEPLLFRLIDDGYMSDQLLLNLLRKSKERKRSLANSSTRHARLVEKLAYHISVSDKTDHRQAFRSVYKLYRYLRDRQVRPGPAMSRALVRAGVTRFLRDELIVPRQRFIWIIGVVSEIEGLHKARHLDMVAGRWMHRVRETKIQAHQTAESRSDPSGCLQSRLPFRRQYKPFRVQMKHTPGRQSRVARGKEEPYRLRGIASGYVVSEDKVLPVKTRNAPEAAEEQPS